MKLKTIENFIIVAFTTPIIMLFMFVELVFKKQESSQEILNKKKRYRRWKND